MPAAGAGEFLSGANKDRFNKVLPKAKIIAKKRIQNAKFYDKKKYEKHIYSLFPSDPIREICKLAGLPMPQADS